MKMRRLKPAQDHIGCNTAIDRTFTTLRFDKTAMSFVDRVFCRLRWRRARRHRALQCYFSDVFTAA